MTVLKKGCKVALSANVVSIGRKYRRSHVFETILTKLLSLACGTAGPGVEDSRTLRIELNSRLY